MPNAPIATAMQQRSICDVRCTFRRAQLPHSCKLFISKRYSRNMQNILQKMFLLFFSKNIYRNVCKVERNVRIYAACLLQFSKIFIYLPLNRVTRYRCRLCNCKVEFSYCYCCDFLFGHTK